MSSPSEKGLTFVCFCSESLLLDFHSWKKNAISWRPRVLWHDVKEEWDYGVSLGRGLQAGLPSCQVSVQCTGNWEGCPVASATIPTHYPRYWSFVLVATELIETISRETRKGRELTKSVLGHMSFIVLRVSGATAVCGWSVKDAYTMFFVVEFSFVSLERFYRHQVFPNSCIRSRVWANKDRNFILSLLNFKPA